MGFNTQLKFVDLVEFMCESWDSKIRPLLNKKTIDTLEKSGATIIQIQTSVRGKGTAHYFNNVLDDIYAKEKEWGLI